jgi:hypothetical protein
LMIKGDQEEEGQAEKQQHQSEKEIKQQLEDALP